MGVLWRASKGQDHVVGEWFYLQTTVTNLRYRQPPRIESRGALAGPAQTPLRGAFSIAQRNNAPQAALMLSGARKLYPEARSALASFPAGRRPSYPGFSGNNAATDD